MFVVQKGEIELAHDRYAELKRRYDGLRKDHDELVEAVRQAAREERQLAGPRRPPRPPRPPRRPRAVGGRVRRSWTRRRGRAVRDGRSGHPGLAPMARRGPRGAAGGARRGAARARYDLRSSRTRSGSRRASSTRFASRSARHRAQARPRRRARAGLQLRRTADRAALGAVLGAGRRGAARGGRARGASPRRGRGEAPDHAGGPIHVLSELSACMGRATSDLPAGRRGDVLDSAAAGTLALLAREGARARLAWTDPRVALASSREADRVAPIRRRRDRAVRGERFSPLSRPSCRSARRTLPPGAPRDDWPLLLS